METFTLHSNSALALGTKSRFSPSYFEVLGVEAPSIMAKLVQSPPKYHPSEWHTSNRLNFTRAEQERAAAERLRAECERLRKETDATTRRTQQSVDHKFSQRIRDIEFWKEELGRKLSDNAVETDLLLERKENLEKALAATQFPMEVAQSCLSLREKRMAIDLVRDDVEIQLQKVSVLVCTSHELDCAMMLLPFLCSFGRKWK